MRLRFIRLSLLLLVFIPCTTLRGIEVWNRYPLDSLYHRPEDILQSIKERVEANPGMVRWEIIGASSNTREPIYAFSISNPVTGPAESKPSVLFHGQHHSEEPIGVEIIFYMSDHFLREYEKDPFVTYLLDNYNLWFVPTANPEGFRIVNRGIYRLKRKNNTDTNMNGILELDKDGVDLNRNYPSNWEKDDAEDPESPYFKGYIPASQAETIAMIDFYAREKFQLAFFYHSSASGSYSERIFFPWKWGDIISPDYEDIHYLAEILASNLPRAYAKGLYSVHNLNTSRRGYARDYIYSQHGTLAMLIETGGDSPYGEGVVNPPNEILKSILIKQTEAMLNLLQEYDRNLLIGQANGEDDYPLSEAEIVIDQRVSPYKKNIVTNNEGYFFHYLPPREFPYEIEVDGHKFTLLRDQIQRTELSFSINNRNNPSFLQEGLNSGEAIIMVNPVFQYFQPLLVREEYRGEVDTIYLSLTDGGKLLYRRALDGDDGEFNLPWIPTNLTKLGTLSLQYSDINPHLDQQKVTNKIVFLNNDREILSYVNDYNPLYSWYLQPEAGIGIDYSLYTSGNNDYMISQINVMSDSAYRSNYLELLLYNEGEIVYQTRDFISYTDRIVFDIPEVPLPDNLFLVLVNRGFKPMSIHQEAGIYNSSNRLYDYNSEWLPAERPDPAIDIYLQREGL